LAIETLIDIGNHVIAELQLGTVDHYRDVPALLAQHGYLDDTLEARWVRMIGFRSILVHDYLDVDRRIVYRVLHEDLEDLEALRRVFAQFL
jgi:uncharacterized protein YutE (UPF0331/DUF86 family)